MATPSCIFQVHLELGSFLWNECLSGDIQNKHVHDITNTTSMQESWDRKLEQRAKEPSCSKSPSLPSPSPSERTPGRALPRGGVQRCRRHGRHVAQGADVAMADRIVKIPRNSPGMWLQHVSNFFLFILNIDFLVYSWSIMAYPSFRVHPFGRLWLHLGGVS